MIHILPLVLLSFSAVAQTADEISASAIGLATRDAGKAAVEVTSLSAGHTAYAYVESSCFPGKPGSGGVYAQFFWEQKFWSAPVFLHAEFRTTGNPADVENACYLGGAYCIYGQNGFLAVEPLYRFSNADGHGGQLSFVGSWAWGRLDLAHFTDVWKTETMPAKGAMGYCEARFYYTIWRRIAAGVVGTVVSDFGSFAETHLYFGLRIRM